jgi:hypothetical protein
MTRERAGAILGGSRRAFAMADQMTCSSTVARGPVVAFDGSLLVLT